MTQLQLESAIAGTTGESLRTIRARGFSLLHPRPSHEDTCVLRLQLDCPFCGRPVAYPGTAADGSIALAECDRCDVDFEVAPTEVYAIAIAL